ncbi:hypothetical protein KAR91_29855 [Candidatus Pacearchaeota archaeon]|nr:hypothetical protein [Candidatus Pacearchaeota archaeon]
MSAGTWETNIEDRIERLEATVNKSNFSDGLSNVCETCAMWVRADSTGLELPIGGCSLLCDYVAKEANGNEPSINGVTFANSLLTQSDFGCNLWRKVR